MVSEADLKAIETLLKNLREQGRGEERRDSVIRKARVDLPNLGVLPGQTPFTVGGRKGGPHEEPSLQVLPCHPASSQAACPTRSQSLPSLSLTALSQGYAWGYTWEGWR